MRTIRLLLNRFGPFLLFLAMQICAFVLIVRYNDNHRKILFSSANRVVGGLFSQVDRVENIFNYAAVADSLAAENARLRRLLGNAAVDTLLRTDTIRMDSMRQVFTYIHARVVSNSVYRNNNFLTLNRGSKHGIKPHMGVISENGVIGVVRKVSENYSQVMSILHRDSRVSALIKRNGQPGPLIWKGENPSMMRLQDIPQHEVIRVGDTVQTTVYSGFYPTGHNIGVVDTFWQDLGSYTYSVDVKLFEDLAKIKYVYVVNNLDKQELQELENEPNQ